MKLQSSGFPTVGQVQDQYLNQRHLQAGETKSGGLSFQEMLDKATGAEKDIRFSKHASGRLSTRNIELTDSQIERLQAGTRKAGEKGIQDSLVLVDSLAFIVNVPSSTVVTAMKQDEAQDNIFTNIDGAVII